MYTSSCLYTSIYIYSYMLLLLTLLMDVWEVWSSPTKLLHIGGPPLRANYPREADPVPNGPI